MKFFLMAVSYQLSAVSKERFGQVINLFNCKTKAKIRKLTIRETCLGILGLTLLFLNSGCLEEKPPPEVLRLEIDTQTTKPLRHALYGFNTNMITGDYGYLDDDFVALTKALAPKTLRFPGGTVGNFYHWEPGGFFESEMDSTLNAKLNKRNKDNYVKLQERRNGEIAFDDFMELCNTLHITPVVVVNLWTGSPEESAAWVRYAKNKGYQITHWELGNEYYLPHYLNKFRTVKAYIVEAKKHAAAMKTVNPDIKLSVCATPLGFHKEGWLVKRQQRKWDEGLAADSSFYDAYTVHAYAYKAVQKKDIEEMRCYLMGWIHFGMAEALDYYQKLFPNKEMWITEWNIANPANRVANTQLHAMYVGDFFLKMLTVPNITQANFHVIAGPGKGFPVFSPMTPITPGTFWKYGGEPESDFGGTIRRAVYPAFQLIGEALAQVDTQFTVSIQNQPLLEGAITYAKEQMPGIQAQAVGKKNDTNDMEHFAILISNRTGEQHTPYLVIDGKHYKGSVTYRYVADERLNATNGGNAEMEGSGEIEVRIQEWSGEATEFLIPKNSFGILKIKE